MFQCNVGCVNGQIQSALISSDFCEDAAQKLPWAYFQPEYQYLYDHCAASMHKYGLYLGEGAFYMSIAIRWLGLLYKYHIC